MNDRHREIIRRALIADPVGDDEWRRLPRARKWHLWQVAEGTTKVYRSLCGAIMAVQLDDAPVRAGKRCAACAGAPIR